MLVLLRNTKTLLREGGHAFPTINTVVPRELLEFNVEIALAKLFGTSKKVPYKLIGNISKPFLGDVDVAISRDFIADFLGVSAEDKTLYVKLADAIKSKIKDSDAKAFPGFQQVSFSTKLLDTKGKQLPAFDRDTHKPNLSQPGVFQIDLMLGDVEYLSKTMSGAPADSSYKAVYRNLLLTAMFSSLEQKTKEIDKITGQPIYTRLDITNKNGIRQMFYVRLPNDKKKVVDSKLIESNPDKLVSLQFKGSLKFDDVNSFEKLWKAFNSTAYRHPTIRDKVVEKFKANLEDAKLPYPKELGGKGA